MKWEVKLYVGGQVFVEDVRAVNYSDAKETAMARNPKAKFISANPIPQNKMLSPDQLMDLKRIYAEMIVDQMSDNEILESVIVDIETELDSVCEYDLRKEIVQAVGIKKYRAMLDIILT